MKNRGLRLLRPSDARSLPGFRWTLPLLALALLAPGAARADGYSLTCERLPELMRSFLQKHVRFHYLSDQLEERAIESYVRRIDPSQNLLLVSEAEALKTDLAIVFDQVREGDCSRLDVLQQDLVERYENMEKFVRETLASEGFAVDPEISLVLDPEKRGRPATTAERDEIYTKLIHFQMSNYLSSDLPLTEAKEKLTHRYELMTRRARELKRPDVYAGFLDAFASSLDPHSNYLSAEVLEDFQIQMALSLEGIGVALSSRDGYSIVEKVIPGGAADRQGLLLPNDKIIAVAQGDGEFVDIIDMNLRDVVRLIRGKRGTTVRLMVLRQADTTDRFEAAIVRDTIDLEEQAARLSYETVEIDGQSVKLAILDLPSFYGDKDPTKRQSANDVKAMLQEAVEAGAQGLLLDLSRNGGGLLEHAVEIAGFFIPKGGVVAVKDTYARVQVLDDPDEKRIFDGPMVVLTSRVSASASEIVAGAIKDYRRAIVVGDDHTFGKGTVQTMLTLPPGLGALKVTTALFFRPGGASTQQSGVEADIILPSLLDTDEFGEAHQPYSLPARRIEAFADRSLKRSEDTPSWLPVTPKLLATLRSRSEARVSSSEEFAKILKKRLEAEEKQGRVQLADILNESESPSEEDDAPESAAGDEAEEPKSPQLQEALRVLADYVAVANDWTPIAYNTTPETGS
ncbi:MAG: S41 family peptidase [Proteobacteria bacterium]|nr:S41 family peptidase [Pseudomonadota bacterium]